MVNGPQGLPAGSGVRLPYLASDLAQLGSRHHPAQKQRLGSRPHNERPDCLVLLRVASMSDRCSPARSALRGKGPPVATREVFSEDELAQLRGFPDPARAQLFTLASWTSSRGRQARGPERARADLLGSCRERVDGTRDRLLHIGS